MRIKTDSDSKGSALAVIAATLLVVFGMAMAGLTPAHADVNTFTLKNPLNNATVRETVPIAVESTDLSQAAYAQIKIDGKFVVAPAVPKTGNVIYEWDTKAPPQIPDGTHTIEVDLFDRNSDEISAATVTVRVSNMITALPDGVQLIYKWHPNQVQTYDYNFALSSFDSLGVTKNTIQSADVRVKRSVEDITGSEILLRDYVAPGGIISSGGGASASGGTATPTEAYVQTLYNLQSKYWTVNKFGEITTNNESIGGGQHFGFSIPQFPPRRVNIGDSWESHLLVGLQWAQTTPTFIRGTSRLDSFEWEDGYPTAKIVETYDGPAHFTIDAAAGTASSGPGVTTLPAVDARSVHITRTVWFAYEAGIPIRIETSMHVNAALSSDQYNALGVVQVAAAGNGPGNGPPGPGNPYINGGAPQAGQPYVPVNPLAQGRDQNSQKTHVKLDVDSTMLFVPPTGG